MRTKVTKKFIDKEIDECVKSIIGKVREAPYYFFNEGDIHSFVFNNLLEKREFSYDADGNFYTFDLNLKLKSPIIHTEIGVPKGMPFYKPRERHDIVIFKPEEFKKTKLKLGRWNICELLAGIELKNRHGSDRYENVQSYIEEDMRKFDNKPYLGYVIYYSADQQPFGKKETVKLKNNLRKYTKKFKGRVKIFYIYTILDKGKVKEANYFFV